MGAFKVVRRPGLEPGSTSIPVKIQLVPAQGRDGADDPMQPDLRS